MSAASCVRTPARSRRSKRAALLAVGLAVAIGGSLRAAQGERRHAEPVRLSTLDPGHFHAALIQKEMYPGVSDVVHVFAPVGADLAAN